MSRKDTFLEYLDSICWTCKRMTTEEAKKRLQDYKQYLVDKEWKETYQLAIESLEKVERYKWHDLRKDPNDLPTCDDYEDVLALFNLESSYGIAYAKDVRSGNYRIIAWKYIEPFEGSDKE